MDGRKDKDRSADEAHEAKEEIVDEIADEAVEPEHDEIREHPDKSYERHVKPGGPRRPVPILTDRDANTDSEKYREDDKD